MSKDLEFEKVTFSYRFDNEDLITLDQFSSIFPNNKEQKLWVGLLNTILPEYSINTKNRISMFLAQCGHESLEFTVLVENLNYSAQGLANTWPSRYSLTDKRPYKPNELANRLHRNPEAIANNCYANRMGNGSEVSGDGWKYRGRGIIQITGKDNYRKVSRKIFGNDELLSKPSWLEEPEYALRSACEYWKGSALNSWSDKGDVATVTRRINGGMNGYQDRKSKYEKFMSIL